AGQDWSRREACAIGPSGRLDHDGRPVAKNLGGGALAASDLGALVPDADDRVRAQLPSVPQEKVIGLLACLLAHLGIRPDLASDQGLEPTEETLADGRGADDEAADQPLVFRNAVALDRERGRYMHRVLHRRSRRIT